MAERDRSSIFDDKEFSRPSAGYAAYCGVSPNKKSIDKNVDFDFDQTLRPESPPSRYEAESPNLPRSKGILSQKSSNGETEFTDNSRSSFDKSKRSRASLPPKLEVSRRTQGLYDHDEDSQSVEVRESPALTETNQERDKETHNKHGEHKNRNLHNDNNQNDNNHPGYRMMNEGQCGCSNPMANPGMMGFGVLPDFVPMPPNSMMMPMVPCMQTPMMPAPPGICLPKRERQLPPWPAAPPGTCLPPPPFCFVPPPKPVPPGWLPNPDGGWNYRPLMPGDVVPKYPRRYDPKYLTQGIGKPFPQPKSHVAHSSEEHSVLSHMLKVKGDQKSGAKDNVEYPVEKYRQSGESDKDDHSKGQTHESVLHHLHGAKDSCNVHCPNGSLPNKESNGTKSCFGPGHAPDQENTSKKQKKHVVLVEDHPIFDSDDTDECVEPIPRDRLRTNSTVHKKKMHIGKKRVMDQDMPKKNNQLDHDKRSTRKNNDGGLSTKASNMRHIPVSSTNLQDVAILEEEMVSEENVGDDVKPNQIDEICHNVNKTYSNKGENKDNRRNTLEQEKLICHLRGTDHEGGDMGEIGTDKECGDMGYVVFHTELQMARDGGDCITSRIAEKYTLESPLMVQNENMTPTSMANLFNSKLAEKHPSSRSLPAPVPFSANSQTMMKAPDQRVLSHLLILNDKQNPPEMVRALSTLPHEEAVMEHTDAVHATPSVSKIGHKRWIEWWNNHQKNKKDTLNDGYGGDQKYGVMAERCMG